MAEVPTVIGRKKGTWKDYSAKGVTSAVIITPPEHFWFQIQDIRRNHDKAYERWMPHINCLYPFVLEPEKGFHKEAIQIKEALSKNKVEPFYVKFGKDSFGYFQHGSRCVVWLKPIIIQQPNIIEQLTEENNMALVLQQRVGVVCPHIPAAQLNAKGHMENVKRSDAKTKGFSNDNSNHREKEKATTSFPKDRTSNMPALVEKITIVEPVIEYNPYRNVSYTGISALHKAVWKDEDLINDRVKPSSMEPGLDCLKFAIWSEDDNKKLDKFNYNFKTDSSVNKTKPHGYQMKKERLKSNKIQHNQTGHTMSHSKYAVLDDPQCEGENENMNHEKSRHGWGNANTDHEKSRYDWGDENINPYMFNCGPTWEEDLNQDDNDSNWETVKANSKPSMKANDSYKESEKGITRDLASDRKSAQTKSKDPNLKAVENLQKVLFETFPFCDDLNKKSKDGFKAHLTLGQCDSKDVETFINDLKSRWDEIRFTVESVYIISRRGRAPFEIREEIKFI